MEKFTADWNKRIPKEEGKKVIENGVSRGQSEPIKDTYWSGYENDDRCYLSLNDEPDTVWEVSREEMESYCEE